MNVVAKKNVERVCRIAGTGLAVATLLGFGGRLFWMFDLLSHFRVQYFQLGLVLIALSIWKRNNRQLVVSILLACLNYSVVLPFYFGRASTSDEKPARAMLMNVLASNGNTRRVVSEIKNVKPDILLLEEVTPAWAEKLFALEGYPYRVADVRGDCFGIMLLSRYPLSNTNVVFVGPAGVPSLIADVHMPQGEITVVGTHPVPPISSEHSKYRNAQMAALPELVKATRKPVLLLGDLNVSPWSAYFTRLLKESGLKNSMKGFGFQPSWPADNRLLRIPIDHVLHDWEINIHSRVTGSAVGSDHLPVIVDFTVQ